MPLSTDVSAPPAWPAGVDRIVLAETDSTMAEAARRAPGLGGPAWILAIRQTAGRGRRGRGWIDPPGNFAATLSLPLQAPPAEAAQRSFVAGLALHDTLALLGAGTGLQLKWPNDLLLNGGKLAGILLEATGEGARTTRLAIGIGVNLCHVPPSLPGALRPVSLAGETAVRVAPELLLDHLAPAVAAREAQFRQCGFAPIREEWLARAAGLGQRVTARLGQDTHAGVFETLDATGALVLATARGRRVIPAGDVFL